MPCSGLCTFQFYEFRRGEGIVITKLKDTIPDLRDADLLDAIRYVYRDKFVRTHVGTSGCQDDCACIETDEEYIRITRWQNYKIPRRIKVGIPDPNNQGERFEYVFTGVFQVRAIIANGICMPRPDGDDSVLDYMDMTIEEL